MIYNGERELHVGQCGLSDQITLQGDKTIYDVLHVVTTEDRNYIVHTLCGSVFTLEGLETNVFYIGHNMSLFNEITICPTCGRKCEG